MVLIDRLLGRCQTESRNKSVSPRFGIRTLENNNLGKKGKKEAHPGNPGNMWRENLSPHRKRQISTQKEGSLWLSLVPRREEAQICRDTVRAGDSKGLQGELHQWMLQKLESDSSAGNECQVSWRRDVAQCHPREGSTDQDQPAPESALALALTLLQVCWDHPAQTWALSASFVPASHALNWTLPQNCQPQKTTTALNHREIFFSLFPLLLVLVFFSFIVCICFLITVNIVLRGFFLFCFALFYCILVFVFFLQSSLPVSWSWGNLSLPFSLASNNFLFFCFYVFFSYSFYIFSEGKIYWVAIYCVYFSDLF